MVACLLVWLYVHMIICFQSLTFVPVHTHRQEANSLTTEAPENTRWKESEDHDNCCCEVEGLWVSPGL